jgi:hypothetical protein
MKIESITIDGIDYDLVEVDRPFNGAECYFWNREEAGCKLEKEEFGWVCPAAIVGRRTLIKPNEWLCCYDECGDELTFDNEDTYEEVEETLLDFGWLVIGNKCYCADCVALKE